ncbi:hypothetical protein DFQ28_006956 [Apophysomyces sp. BC1034]|nr:hypothetical protein DFQ30_005333 [Apophysomyces sp. BC1015]KAG0172505.1 hypothetical protein DFQ29_008342 [Apophysomyces sp. BC1021]KAG0187037.1 hypothetical protein DFQ28_006956 [Apophysomyces sp. BC1034]
MSCNLNNNQFVAQQQFGFDPNMTLFYSQTPHTPAMYQQFATASSPLELQPHQQQHLQHRSSFQQSAFPRQQQLLYQQQAMQFQEQQQQAPPSPNKKTQSKAERRAEHNAIERARRESLNTKFQQLAHSLPNLQNDRRPSKGTIIERTLEFVKQTLQKEEQFRTRITKLQELNEQLKYRIKTGSDEDDSCVSMPDFLDDHSSCKSNSSSSVSSVAMPSVGGCACGCGGHHHHHHHPSSSSSTYAHAASPGPAMPIDPSSVSPVAVGLSLQQQQQQQDAWGMFPFEHDLTMVQFPTSASPCEDHSEDDKSTHAEDHQYHCLPILAAHNEYITKGSPMTNYQAKYESFVHH